MTFDASGRVDESPDAALKDVAAAVLNEIENRDEKHSLPSDRSRTYEYPPQAPVVSVLASRDAGKRPHSRPVRRRLPHDLGQRAPRAVRGAARLNGPRSFRLD